MKNEKAGFSTLCVHGGEELDSQGGIHVPLYNHSTFGFPSTQALLDVVEGRKEGNLYTRYGLNPTIRAVERKLALLEGGELAFVFSSGMAAEAATFLTHCKAGDHIVWIGDVYGGTTAMPPRPPRWWTAWGSSPSPPAWVAPRVWSPSRSPRRTTA